MDGMLASSPDPFTKGLSQVHSIKDGHFGGNFPWGEILKMRNSYWNLYQIGRDIRKIFLIFAYILLFPSPPHIIYFFPSSPFPSIEHSKKVTTYKIGDKTLIRTSPCSHLYPRPPPFRPMMLWHNAFLSLKPSCYVTQDIIRTVKLSFHYKSAITDKLFSE